MAEDTQYSSTNVIKSVETSIEIIEVLQARGTAGISELADSVGCSKGNVYKHLHTLENHGFVSKRNGEYQLGLRYLDIGGFVRESLDGSHVIKSKILELADETDEVAQYMVEHRGRAIIVYREAGQRAVPTRTRVGSYLPIHQVAGGKAILAHLPEERIEAIIDRHGLPSATENTITDRAALYEELERVREQGYAVNDAESTEGLFAMAAPVRMPSNEVIGACAVSGPAHRMKAQAKLDEIPEVLLSFVNEIELNLTHS